MISLKNIKYNIDNKKILDNISLDFFDGEICVLTGPNGAGKTTLLKIIMGILTQNSGKIFLENKDISKFSISDRANLGLSFAFQQPIAFKGLTVQNLLEIANPLCKKIDYACEYLSKVGLCARNYLNREFNHNLSGGEMKRIELAITLSKNSQNNLFDEPEAGIDMWSFENLTTIFKNLKKNNKCVVIISHEPKIMEIADKIIVLGQDGKIEKQGTFKQIFKNTNELKCIKLKGGK